MTEDSTTTPEVTEDSTTAPELTEKTADESVDETRRDFFSLLREPIIELFLQPTKKQDEIIRAIRKVITKETREAILDERQRLIAEKEATEAETDGGEETDDEEASS